MLTLPMSDDPQVSLVIAMYGNADMTLRCLRAIADHTPAIYETLVVDCSSPDGAGDVIERNVSGVVVLRCENLGFGHGQNVGRARARAPFVCILSNDLFPETGWLEPLRARAADPRIGIVCPMLLNEDGSVQEAGVSMGRDGFPWRWGQGASPDDPEVNFPRAIDYGTGCMFVRGEAYDASGGFRPEYGLGYLEDADLALTIASLGWRAVYEPASRMVHLNHGTFGAERAEQLSAENRPKLLARWGEALRDRPPLRHAVLHPAYQVEARDALASHRIVLVAGEDGWEPTAREIAARLPDARVTVVRGAQVSAGEGRALLADGIEVIQPEDPDAWLTTRRGHADVVWTLDEPARDRFGDALGRTQAQAAFLHGPSAGLTTMLASAGVSA